MNPTLIAVLAAALPELLKALGASAPVAPAPTPIPAPEGWPPALPDETQASSSKSGGSDGVRLLQIALKAAGGDVGEIDGLSGPKTEAALSALIARIMAGLSKIGV